MPNGSFAKFRLDVSTGAKRASCTLDWTCGASIPIHQHSPQPGGTEQVQAFRRSLTARVLLFGFLNWKLSASVEAEFLISELTPVD